ncbi:1-phosphofructokinase [Ruminococcus sp. FC2018]|uniref:1-phosphofructokinase n=1 Tax=Ruminococcus sp. FC2018 TaxID=1410617 RepID=UPI000490693D|nr:1-phosphofructokinase [Ruminococcus sp. FC2018]
MVYTVTFNPAIDYVVRTGEIIPGAVNRTLSEEICFGGKGINVSLVLKELGVESVALGFVAGFTGKAIEHGVSRAGIKTDFITLEQGISRINVKIRSSQETEINGQGPCIGKKELDMLFDKLDKLQSGDILVLAGSIPGSVPTDIYERILERLSGRNIRAVVDATNDLLLNVLKYKPFLVKPNDHELGEMLGEDLRSIEDVEKGARKLRSMGAQNVLVSMAEKGALLIDDTGNLHQCPACKGTLVNSVGAGDSMVAGFVAGSLKGDNEYALKLGTAAGGATAFSNALATADEISQLLKQLI